MPEAAHSGDSEAEPAAGRLIRCEELDVPPLVRRQRSGVRVRHLEEEGDRGGRVHAAEVPHGGAAGSILIRSGTRRTRRGRVS